MKPSFMKTPDGIILHLDNIEEELFKNDLYVRDIDQKDDTVNNMQEIILEIGAKYHEGSILSDDDINTIKSIEKKIENFLKSNKFTGIIVQSNEESLIFYVEGGISFIQDQGNGTRKFASKRTRKKEKPFCPCANFEVSETNEWARLKKLDTTNKVFTVMKTHPDFIRNLTENHPVVKDFVGTYLPTRYVKRLPAGGIKKKLDVMFLFHSGVYKYRMNAIVIPGRDLAYIPANYIPPSSAMIRRVSRYGRKKTGKRS